MPADPGMHSAHGAFAQAAASRVRAVQVANGIARVEAVLPRLSQLALGGTAVGTGLNTIEGYDVDIANRTAAERHTLMD